MEGQGNISYAGPSGGGNAGTVTGANDGLTDVSNVAKLGQSVGAAGNPAALTEDREIPFGGNRLYFGKNDGVSDVILFDPEDGIDIFNAAGARYALASFGRAWQIQIVDANTIQETFMGSSIFYRLPNNAFSYNNAYFQNAVRSSIATPESFGAFDDVILIDSTAGNYVVTFQPPSGYPGKKGVIKKISTDFNTITFNFSAAGPHFYGSEGPVATFTFSTAGESIEFVSDGTNIYII